MSKNGYSIENIKEYEAFTPTTVEDAGIIPPSLSDSEDDYKRFGVEFKPYFISADDAITDCYVHVPMLIEPDLVPWINANLFIRHLLELGRDRSTISTYATDLKLFGNYCHENKINYLECKSFLRSPISRYKRELQNRVNSQTLAPSTAKERITRLVKFYRYLEDELGVQFNSCPWGKDKKGMASFESGHGASKKTHMKEYESSEVQQFMKGASREDAEAALLGGEILDNGERLRPLTETQCRILFTTLTELDNTEMSLLHQIIYSTGARTQTVFTLRQANFEYVAQDFDTEIIINAGCSSREQSLVDSKGNRPFVVKMPIFLYKAVQVYIASPRAQNRYNRAKFKFDNGEQYVFITNQGQPFYAARTDPFRSRYDTYPTGSAVASFVRERLKPKLKENGFENYQNYKPHNLRATFGCNKLDLHLSLIDDDSDNKAQQIDRAYNDTRRDLNHRSLDTTYIYIRYRSQSKIVKKINTKWEEFLLVGMYGANHDK